MVTTDVAVSARFEQAVSVSRRVRETGYSWAGISTDGRARLVDALELASCEFGRAEPDGRLRMRLVLALLPAERFEVLAADLLCSFGMAPGLARLLVVDEAGEIPMPVLRGLVAELRAGVPAAVAAEHAGVSRRSAAGAAAFLGCSESLLEERQDAAFQVAVQVADYEAWLRVHGLLDDEFARAVWGQQFARLTRVQEAFVARRPLWPFVVEATGLSQSGAEALLADALAAARQMAGVR